MDFDKTQLPVAQLLKVSFEIGWLKSKFVFDAQRHRLVANDHASFFNAVCLRPAEILHRYSVSPKEEMVASALIGFSDPHLGKIEKTVDESLIDTVRHIEKVSSGSVADRMRGFMVLSRDEKALVKAELAAALEAITEQGTFSDDLYALRGQVIVESETLFGVLSHFDKHGKLDHYFKQCLDNAKSAFRAAAPSFSFQPVGQQRGERPLN